MKYFISFGVLLETPALCGQFIVCTYFQVMSPTCMLLEIKKSQDVEYKLNDFHFFIFYILNVCVLCIIDTYTIFDGLTHNTRGYFACCEIFFRASGGATENTSNKQNTRIRYFVHKKPSCRAVFSQPKKIPRIIPETL